MKGAVEAETWHGQAGHLNCHHRMGGVSETRTTNQSSVTASWNALRIVVELRSTFAILPRSDPFRARFFTSFPLVYKKIARHLLFGPLWPSPHQFPPTVKYLQFFEDFWVCFVALICICSPLPGLLTSCLWAKVLIVLWVITDSHGILHRLPHYPSCIAMIDNLFYTTETPQGPKGGFSHCLICL